MKYVEEFRNQALARGLASAIAAEVDGGREYRLMEFCGGHTHAIFRYGVQDLMPANVRFVHGPGCPVCVLPTARIDQAIELAERHRVTLCTYADLMRVPGGGRRSLLKAKGGGLFPRSCVRCHQIDVAVERGVATARGLEINVCSSAGVLGAVENGH